MPEIEKGDFAKIVAGIKKEIKTTQARTMRQVNNNMIMMYFRIGKILYDNSVDDIYFIKNVATELRMGFRDLKGFSVRNLQNMRAFYVEYKDSQAAQQAVAQLSWGHNLLLMSKIKNKATRMIYVEAVLENGWSRSMLDMQIQNKYHKRIGASANNFKTVLSSRDGDMANHAFKDPYIFDFLMLRDNYRERELEGQMVEKIKNVLLELGNGWSFVGNQYKIIVEGKEYLIDMLFYHLKLRCYVVVELKATEFAPEFIGKLNFYLSAVDELVKSEDDNPSIGLILCREKGKISVQYSLKNVSSPIGVSSFKTSALLSGDILKQLPSEDELNLHIAIDS